MSSRIGFRTIAIASVAALAFGVASAPAQASVDATKIDTYSTWDGQSRLGSFGNPDTATYGQTFTAPDGTKKFKKVTWYMAGGNGTMVLRAELYTWDGSKAGKEVAEAKAKTVKFTEGAPDTAIKFKFKKGKITPGQQYVVFATISKDYEATDPGFTTTWPVHSSDVLAGGNTVWLNDSGDESQWTTQPWSGVPTYDMAFKATLK